MKLGMAADASDDEEMFEDLVVDDLEAEPEPECMDGVANGMAGAEEDAPGDAVVAAMAQPSRPPLHPGKPTAVHAEPAAQPAADVGEGQQDSCSVGSVLCADPTDQPGQEADQAEQGKACDAAAAEGSAASREDNALPDLAEPTATEPAEDCHQPEAEALGCEAAQADAVGDADTTAAGAALGADGAANQDVVSVTDTLALQAKQSGGIPGAQAVQMAAEPQVPAVPAAPAAASKPSPGQSAPCGLALRPAQAATTLSLPAAPPAPLKPGGSSAGPAGAATAPAALQPLMHPKQLPVPQAALANASKPGAAAAPAATLLNLSLRGASTGSTSHGMPLWKPAGLEQGSSSASFKLPSSRFGLPPSNSSVPAGKTAAVPTGSAAGLPKTLAAAAAPKAKQHPLLPVLRPSALAAANRQPGQAGMVGTPLSSLPKHMQAGNAGTASAQKVLTPAPFTPPVERAAHAAALPRLAEQQQHQVAADSHALSPRAPTPALLADDILAADFGPSAVLEGHEACMQESAALCVPIGDAVQEQVLALDQLALEAEALRRRVNSLRVDLTVHRSTLAFMDSPLQAHGFEAAKRKAAEMLEGLTAYQPPVFDIPPPMGEAEQAPPPFAEEHRDQAGAAAPAPAPDGSLQTEGNVDMLVGTAQIDSPADASAQGGGTLLMPRALEPAFNEQPLTEGRLGAPVSADVSAGLPTQETAGGPGVPPTQETGSVLCGQQAEHAGVAAVTEEGPMEAEAATPVSVVLCIAGEDGVVVSLTV